MAIVFGDHATTAGAVECRALAALAAEAAVFAAFRFHASRSIKPLALHLCDVGQVGLASIKIEFGLSDYQLQGVVFFIPHNFSLSQIVLCFVHVRFQLLETRF